MHPHLKYLIELQAVDFRLIEIRERLSRFPKRLAEVEGRVTAARQQITTAKEALTSSLKDRKTFEMDVEQWKERAKKYRNQSSEVKTNEAYKALLHEIANAEDEVAKAEDRLLDRMVAGEEYERQVKAAEAAVKDIEATANVERHAIQAEYNAAQKELAAAEAVARRCCRGGARRSGRSLRAHRETPWRHRPRRSSRRRLRPVRRPHPAARDPATDSATEMKNSSTAKRARASSTTPITQRQRSRCREPAGSAACHDTAHILTMLVPVMQRTGECLKYLDPAKIHDKTPHRNHPDSLFAEPESPSARMEGAYTANIDGAARGNPGPASYGVVIRRPDGKPLESLGKYIGRHTNNVAEYYALIAALDYAAANGIKRLRVLQRFAIDRESDEGPVQSEASGPAPAARAREKTGRGPRSVHNPIHSARTESRSGRGRQRRAR